MQYRIHFKHYTREQMIAERMPRPNPCYSSNGSTQAILQFETHSKEWDTLRVGVSFCHPKDKFNKARGRKLAMKDLFSRCDLFLSSGKRNLKLRDKLWRLYFDHVRVEENVKFLASQARQAEKQ